MSPQFVLECLEQLEEATTTARGLSSEWKLAESLGVLEPATDYAGLLLTVIDEYVKEASGREVVTLQSLRGWVSEKSKEIHVGLVCVKGAIEEQEISRCIDMINVSPRVCDDGTWTYGNA